MIKRRSFLSIGSLCLGSYSVSLPSILKAQSNSYRFMGFETRSPVFSRSSIY